MDLSAARWSVVLEMHPQRALVATNVAGAFGDLGTLVPFIIAYLALLRMDPFASCDGRHSACGAAQPSTASMCLLIVAMNAFWSIIVHDAEGRRKRSPQAHSDNVTASRNPAARSQSIGIVVPI